MKKIIRNVGKIDVKSCAFLICDVQEVFRDLIWQMPTVINTTKFLINTSMILDIPCVITEQYPQALGSTVPEIKQLFENEVTHANRFPIFEKRQFSMITENVQTHLNHLNKKTFIICGIETHVCVQQTCLDLLENGHDVHVIVDGVSSQRKVDRAVGLQRLQQSGAYLTTLESSIFMMLQNSNHPQFRTISKMIKARNLLENGFENSF